MTRYGICGFALMLLPFPEVLILPSYNTFLEAFVESLSRRSFLIRRVTQLGHWVRLCGMKMLVMVNSAIECLYGLCGQFSSWEMFKWSPH